MFYHTVLAAKLHTEVESSANLKPPQGPTSMGTMSSLPRGWEWERLLSWCLNLLAFA